MANSWVRLWVDMPTDPKFRIVAKASGQPLSAVIAVFTFMLTDAANANERGRTQANDEVIASALDLEMEQIRTIRAAMQKRVLDGDKLTGWDKRQPKREDNSGERAKAWREAQKNEGQERTQQNASKRKRTQDTDTDKEEKEKTFVQFWNLYPRREAKKDARRAWEKIQLAEVAPILANVKKRKLNGWKDPQFIPLPATYLNGRRWEDEAPQTAPDPYAGAL